MVRVEVKNFQSIAHEVVEVDGFSALVGRSNIGKSAVVRAIKAALTGPPADGYVRHDALCLRIVKGAKSCKCFCSVHVQAEGLDLLWEKGDAINRYVHNGTEHTVVGRGTPEFLANSGFSLVQIGDTKELLQVSDQFTPIFILNKTGNVVADVLSDVAKLDEINSATRLVEKDRKEAAATRKVRDKDILELRGALLRYEGLDAAVDQVQAVEELDRQVEAATQRLSKLDHFVETGLGIARRVKSLEQIKAVTVPEIDPLVQAGTRFEALGRFAVTLRDSATVVAALAPVEAVALPEVRALGPDGVKLAALTSLAVEYQVKTAALTGLEGVEKVVPPDLDALGPLGETHRKLLQWAVRLDGMRPVLARAQKTAAVVLPTVEPVVEIQGRYRLLHAWVDRAQSAVKTVAELKAAMEAATQAEAEVLAEFKALGVCPTCRREFTADHPNGVH